jgi:hypothetical protein
MKYLDKIDDGNRVDEAFKNVPVKDFEGDTVARMFACAGTISFFKNLSLSVIFQNGYFVNGRIEMYLCVPPSVFIVSKCASWCSHLVLHLFTDDCLLAISRLLYLSHTGDPLSNTLRVRIHHETRPETFSPMENDATGHTEAGKN